MLKNGVLGVLKRCKENRQMACKIRGGDRETKRNAEKGYQIYRKI